MMISQLASSPYGMGYPRETWYTSPRSAEPNYYLGLLDNDPGYNTPNYQKGGLLGGLSSQAVIEAINVLAQTLQSAKQSTTYRYAQPPGGYDATASFAPAYGTSTPSYMPMGGYPQTGVAGVHPTPQFKSAGATMATDFLAQVPQVSTLLDAAKQTELVGKLQQLEQGGPVTIFAPSNEAFNSLPKEVLTKLAKPENRHVLARILSYHVSAQPLAATKNLVAQNVSNQTGTNAYYYNGSVRGGVITNEASTAFPDGQLVKTQAPVSLPNGSIIVPIDKVMIPPDVDLTQLA
jgi:uncharacterized surface protein with fasciclin (FAS1) repeats